MVGLDVRVVDASVGVGAEDGRGSPALQVVRGAGGACVDAVRLLVDGDGRGVRAVVHVEDAVGVGPVELRAARDAGRDLEDAQRGAPVVVAAPAWRVTREREGREERKSQEKRRLQGVRPPR